MEQYNEIVQIISLTLGVAWASGINLYATIFVMACLATPDTWICRKIF